MLRPDTIITKPLTSAAALLIAVSLGLAGCASVEYVPPSQEIHQQLGTVAVLSRSVHPSMDIDEPIKGAGTGALIGARKGAASGLQLSADMCSGAPDPFFCTIGLIFGVVIAVPGAVIGSAVGAGAAHSTQEVEAATENLVQALMDAKPDQVLQEHLLQEVMTEGPCNLRPFDAKNISTTGYQNLAAEGFDSVLEIQVRSLEVHVAGDFSPDISPKLTVEARLLRTTDDTELYRRAWLYWGPQRNYFRMATANAHLLRQDLEYGYRALANRIVHDLFRSEANERKTAPKPGRIVTIEAPTVPSDEATEEPPSETRAAPIPCPEVAPTMVAFSTVGQSRWVGAGGRDACGRSWAMDLIQQDNRITGRVILEGVEYDTHGVVGDDGSMHEARAAKSAESKGALGPRFLNVSLDFGDSEAIGHYAVETTNYDACATAIKLKRYTAN